MKKSGDGESVIVGHHAAWCPPISKLFMGLGNTTETMNVFTFFEAANRFVN